MITHIKQYKTITCLNKDGKGNRRLLSWKVCVCEAWGEQNVHTGLNLMNKFLSLKRKTVGC